MTGQLRQDVLGLVREHIPGSPAIDDGTELLSSRLLDSLAVVALISAVEEQYDLEFPPEHMVPETFRSAAGLAAVVASLVADEHGERR